MLGKEIKYSSGESKLFRDSRYFQARCFAVELRGSNLLEKEEVLERLEAIVGRKDDVAYCVGAQVCGQLANYRIVVRTGGKGRVRLRNVREKFVRGHAVGSALEKDCGNFGFALLVPADGAEKVLNDFVLRVVELCDMMDCVYLKNEESLFRVQDKSYSRPGRVKRALARRVERVVSSG